MADTNGTTTPGNGTSRPPLICSHPDEYKGDEGGCRMCQMPHLTKAVESIRTRRPPPPKAEDAPPPEEVCSPLRAPPPPPSTFKAPSRCTCPDDSRWLADGSCDRCGTPAMRVYERAAPEQRGGEAQAPSLAAILVELRSIIRDEFEALRGELAKLRSERAALGPREIDVGPSGTARSPARRVRAEDRRRLTVAELERRLGCDRRTIYGWYTRGDFPRPSFLGGGRRLWFLDEVETWEEGRAALPPPAGPPHPVRG